MDGDKVLDLLFDPVRVTLVLIDRAQLKAIDEGSRVFVGSQPGAQPLDRVWLVLVVALD